MEEKERNYESPLGVPGGHNLPDEDCIHGDPVNGHDDDRRREFKPGGHCLTLPRYVKSHSEGNRDENNDVSGTESRISSRKVDSLPSNITMLSLEQEKRSKRKGVLKSVGYFFQKLTRRFSLANSTGGIKIKLGQRGSSSTASSNSSNGGNGSINDYHLGTLGGRKSENGSAAGSSHALDRSCAGQTAQTQSSCRLTLDEIPGMIGIHNHGNTCFMNAIVQCLSNTEPLLSYFLSDQYKEDIKRANKHNSKRFGTKGELTEHLATLLKSLWLKKYTSDVSTEFRTIVGKYGSQYRGSFQHDVQEFLMWLLDKVHEDLNIATKKKYRANKSSFGRTDEDVAAEAMANHARCNNSFIHDLFQALYMSSLTCPTCHHQSNTFDPFLSVSLPIPRTSLVQPVLAICLGLARPDSSAERPCQRIGVVLERGHTVKDLKEELTRRCRFFEGLCPAELLILEVNGKQEFHILDDSRLISDPLNNELLYAVDISNRSTQPSPETAANKTPADVCSATTAIHQSGQARRHSFNKKNQPETTCSNGVGNPPSGLVNGHRSDEGSRSSPVGQIGRNSNAEDESKQGQETIVESPEMSLVVVMNSLSFGDDVKKLSLPVLLRLPVFVVVDSGRLHASLKETLNITQQEADAKYYLITEGGNSNFVRAELSLGTPGTTQAELEEVRRSLVQAATTSIGRDGSITPVFRMLVEWNDPSLNEHFQLAEDVEDDDSVQVAVKLQAQANFGTLDECFQVYTQEEMLGEDNDWHCPNCRAPKRGATKSLTLWSLPEILVIHLKRFRQDHEHRSKLNTLILFPLTGLDLRHHMPKGSAFNWEDPSVTSPAASAAAGPGAPVTGNWNAAMQLKSSKQQSSWLSWRLRCKTNGSVYDLYAVCNHYGDMQGGHYTAFCRNPVTNTWCLFNDSRASPISEDEVITRAAYLLFYRKRSTRSTDDGCDAQPESKARPSGTDGIRNCDAGGNPDRPGDLRSADMVPADVDADPGRDLKDRQTPAVRFGLSTSSSSVPMNRGARSTPSTGPVTIPLSSVESRPWLVSLLEERRRLHGLSHTITQTDASSHRISRAITSHSLDDLLDGDCDESREDDFRGVPVYTTLHPPPRIQKQQAKPPMATISTDSVPMAAVGEGLVHSGGSSSGSSPVKNSGDDTASSDAKESKNNLSTSGILCKSEAQHPAVRPSTPSSKSNGDSKTCSTNDRDKFSPPVSKDSRPHDPIKLNQTNARHRFLEGID